MVTHCNHGNTLINTLTNKNCYSGIASPETKSESGHSKDKATVMEMALEFWPDIKALFSNGPYMCCTLSQAFTGFLIGACSFLPKLVQIGLK